MPSIPEFISRIGFGKRRGSQSTQGPPSTAPAPALNHPQGLEVVTEGTNPVVDIVVVHGLNGHHENTWTAENGVRWLRDLLRIDIAEVRILAWGYDANTFAVSGTCCSFLYDHTRILVSNLNRRRELTDSSERPIIFIAHSLRAIVAKSALIHSDAARQGALLEHRSIKLSTYRILFMGTPSSGRKWHSARTHPHQCRLFSCQPIIISSSILRETLSGSCNSWANMALSVVNL